MTTTNPSRLNKVLVQKIIEYNNRNVVGIRANMSMPLQIAMLIEQIVRSKTSKNINGVLSNLSYHLIKTFQRKTDKLFRYK